MTTDASLREIYNKQGFVVIENFFEQHEHQKILEDMHCLVKQQLLHHSLSLKSTLEDDLYQLFMHNQTDYLHTIKAFSRVSSLHRAFNSEGFFSFLAKMDIQFPTIPTGPVAHLMSDKLRFTDGYFGQGAHQDWTSMYSSLNALTIWVSLTDVGENNFPLEVIAGSHLNGQVKGRETADYFEVDLAGYDDSVFTKIKVKANCAIAFSPFLIHRTGIDKMSGFRLASSYRVDDAAEHYNVTRAYYTAYTRSVNRTIPTEQWPSIESIQQQYK